MPPPAVVPDLDESKKLSARLSSSLKQTVNEEFLCQSRKEALDNSVIPAITYATHTHREASLLQQSLISTACVLHTTIGVMQSPFSTSVQKSHPECRNCKFLIEPCP